MKATDQISMLRKWIRSARAGGSTVGFVPTMGYLHEGHLSLVDLARERSRLVVMSIFVNPIQFGPGEDYARYPRDLSSDLRRAEAGGVDIVFHPGEDLMYPEGVPLTYIDMEQLTEGLCGASRPGHFRGVLTVVAKLLHLVEPDIAVFGQKDIQQLIVVERMVRDLDFPVEIVRGPIVREEDGLAMSSRNRYLDKAERKEARRLYRSLRRGKELIRQGERESERLIEAMRRALAGPAVRVDYLSIVDFSTLKPVERINGKTIVAVAAYVGLTRLIDNFIVEFLDDGPTFTL